MKPFDLEKALAGEPVRLRNGSKAYVKYRVDDNPEITQKRDLVYPLVGYWIKEGLVYDIKWSLEGNAFFALNSSPYNIESMWEEPRPRVQLDLPAPLETVQKGQEVYYLELSNQFGPVSKFNFNEDNPCAFQLYKNGCLFATKEDAQEWLEAMREARR